MNGNIEELNQKLMPIYSEIISACLDYSQGKTDYIYVLGINVCNSHYMNNCFFKKHDSFFKKHKIYEEIGVIISDEKQSEVLNNLKIMKELYKLFIEYTGESPTEVKLKYNVQTGKFGVNLSYSDRIEKSETLTPNDVFNEWFEEAKSGNVGL